ncbi:hypothetical protein MPL3356_60483 [Mesorhizobium plurifarium]|uniref:Uncharacterized protein n=1 Tax=Mesorhizobium plurifarium TaxID=69974 RepID=A0A090E9Q2_MESPL|nr:hypothetical protein MPL3356_60483 [Mesorhizobium plurifarium]
MSLLLLFAGGPTQVDVSASDSLEMAFAENRDARSTLALSDDVDALLSETSAVSALLGRADILSVLGDDAIDELLGRLHCQDALPFRLDSTATVAATVRASDSLEPAIAGSAAIRAAFAVADALLLLLDDEAAGIEIETLARIVLDGLLAGTIELTGSATSRIHLDGRVVRRIQ